MDVEVFHSLVSGAMSSTVTSAGMQRPMIQGDSTIGALGGQVSDQFQRFDTTDSFVPYNAITCINLKMAFSTTIFRIKGLVFGHENSNRPAFEIRLINLSRPEELDAVARNTLKSHFETIPETRGRADLPNMTFESMRDMLGTSFRKLDRCCFVVFNSTGKVIGHRILVIKIDNKGDRFGEGWNLFIDPKYRKLGIASQLMQEADTWFRAQKVKYLETGTHVDNKKMQNLYAKQGYRFERFDHNGTNPVYVVRKYLEPEKKGACES